MHTGGVWVGVRGYDIGPPHQIFEKLIWKNAIKPKINLPLLLLELEGELAELFFSRVSISKIKYYFDLKLFFIRTSFIKQDSIWHY